MQWCLCLRPVGCVDALGVGCVQQAALRSLQQQQAPATAADHHVGTVLNVWLKGGVACRLLREAARLCCELRDRFFESHRSCREFSYCEC
jgi:hypothetical protein